MPALSGATRARYGLDRPALRGMRVLWGQVVAVAALGALYGAALLIGSAVTADEVILIGFTAMLGGVWGLFSGLLTLLGYWVATTVLGPRLGGRGYALCVFGAMLGAVAGGTAFLLPSRGSILFDAWFWALPLCLVLVGAAAVWNIRVALRPSRWLARSLDEDLDELE